MLGSAKMTFLFLRSITEYCSVDFHSSLTLEQNQSKYRKSVWKSSLGKCMSAIQLPWKCQAVVLILLKNVLDIQEKKGCSLLTRQKAKRYLKSTLHVGENTKTQLYLSLIDEWQWQCPRCMENSMDIIFF